MKFLQMARERHSVRKYAPTPVDEGKLREILEAGRIAPTAANRQPQRFLVVSSGAGLAKLGKAGNLHGAPLAIVVCGLEDKAWKRPQDGHSMVDIDTAIAATHIILQAWAEGIGSCWITWFDPAIVKREFELPDNVVPVHILALGYELEKPEFPESHLERRMPLADMVWNEAAPLVLK